MNQRVKIFLITFLFALISVNAQNDSLNSFESVLQTIFGETVGDEVNENIYDLIEQYKENPIDLNNSNKNELMKLPFIDIQQINDIIKYRNKHGKIYSFSEFKMLPNISKNTIVLLKYFTYLERLMVNDSSILKNITAKYRSRFSKTIQLSEGYKSMYYNGAPFRLYNRIKTDFQSKIKFGFLVEKDPGEKSYFDFYSGYFKLNNLIEGLSFIIGNYTYEFGQGLAMWSPYSFSKGSEATNSIIKKARGISEYTSVSEYRYLTGGSVQYSHKIFSFLTFYSSNNNTLFNYKQSTFGLSTSLKPLKNFDISFLYYARAEADNSKNYLNQPNMQKYSSLAYKFINRNILITGEFSLTNKLVASINTFQLSFLGNLVLVASVRNYPTSYNSYYANGFGETNNTMNEFGLYFGIKWRTKLGIINFYIDQYKFPESIHNIPLSSIGNDLSFSYKTNIISNTVLFIRYFYESKEGLEQENGENKILFHDTNKFRFEIAYNVNKKVNFKTRAEILRIQNHDAMETGTLLFQDVKINFNNNFVFWGRIIFFDTDSYNSRIYEFENDLVGVMNNQPLWGSGVKWYLLLKYRLFKNISFSAKFTELYKPKSTFLGSGHNLILGNIENKLSMQLDLSF